MKLAVRLPLIAVAAVTGGYIALALPTPRLSAVAQPVAVAHQQTASACVCPSREALTVASLAEFMKPGVRES